MNWIATGTRPPSRDPPQSVQVHAAFLSNVLLHQQVAQTLKMATILIYCVVFSLVPQLVRPTWRTRRVPIGKQSFLSPSVWTRWLSPWFHREAVTKARRKSTQRSLGSRHNLSHKCSRLTQVLSAWLRRNKYFLIFFQTPEFEAFNNLPCYISVPPSVPQVSEADPGSIFEERFSEESWRWRNRWHHRLHVSHHHQSRLLCHSGGDQRGSGLCFRGWILFLFKRHNT